MLSHYVASKGGVIGLTRSVAREMGAHNIHVNCITPGAIKTEAEAKVMTEEQAQAMVNFQWVQRVLGQDRSAKTNSWFRLLQTKRVDQRRECGRLLPSARVIKEEPRKWLTPIIQHADEFPARQLRRHPFI